MTDRHDSPKPARRRHARLLVAPFCDVLAAPHFEGASTRRTREVVQDLSRRGVSFFTSDAELVARADRIRAVTLKCPDGLSATLGVSAAQVRRTDGDRLPARMALEFAYPRPRFRAPRRFRRLADGFFAPNRREDAPGLVRAILGADLVSRDRRAADRIRVPLEADIVVRLERGGAAVAEAKLADVAPRGFGCIAERGFELDGPIDAVRLIWQGRELIRRAVEVAAIEAATVRGEPRSRLRIVIAGDAHPTTWDLPLWTGPKEFGWIRLADAHTRPRLIQAALLAREELVVDEARSEDDLKAARDLSYRAYVENGWLDPEQTPRDAWADRYEHESTVLVARAGGLVAGTIRLVRDGPLGLPHRDYCPREHWPSSDVRRVEAGRLAVSRTYRLEVNARLGVAVLLMVAAAERCFDQGMDCVLLGAQTSQERFYRAIGLRAVSPVFAHLEYGVPAKLFELDLRSEKAMRRFLRLRR